MAVKAARRLCCFNDARSDAKAMAQIDYRLLGSSYAIATQRLEYLRAFAATGETLVDDRVCMEIPVKRHRGAGSDPIP